MKQKVLLLFALLQLFIPSLVFVVAGFFVVFFLNQVSLLQKCQSECTFIEDMLKEQHLTF